MPEMVQKSSATAKVGAALGGVGTGLGLLNALGGMAAIAAPFVAGNCAAPVNHCGVAYGAPIMDHCGGPAPEDHFVTRYDASKDARIAKLESDIALRDANTFTDGKMLELYKYVDGKFAHVEGELARQAVNNQAVKDSFQLAAERTESQGRELKTLIECESKDRRCADTILTTYMNATFYPKQVADVETDDTTTAQPTYNPLPVALCDCC